MFFFEKSIDRVFTTTIMVSVGQNLFTNQNNVKRMITITWPSASGKTSLWEELIKLWWKTLYNYTTRPMRNDSELDSYIFLTDKQYEEKLNRGEFSEHIEYGEYQYAMSSLVPEGNVFAIVTPDGREQFFRIWERLWIDELTSFFITIDEELRRSRLIERGDSEQEIERRMNDWFEPTEECILINWETDSDELARVINENIWA